MDLEETYGFLIVHFFMELSNLKLTVLLFYLFKMEKDILRRYLNF